MSTILTNKIETKSGGLTLDPGAGGSVTVLGSLSGTITTAAQTNITSVGTLSSLAVSGNSGFGTSSPSTKVHALASGTPFSSSAGTVSVFQRSGASFNGCEVSIIAGNGGSSVLNFGDTDDENVGYLNYVHSDNSLRIGTGAAERIRIPSSGGITVTNGNIAMSNGYGIDFSAVAGGGATSSLLDDYEEGTWTPQYTLVTSGTATMGTKQIGKYTKIGNQVTLFFALNTASVSSPTGELRISGLPFISGTDNRGGGGIGFIRRWGTDMPNFRALVSTGSSEILLFKHASNSASNTNVQGSDMSSGYAYNDLDGSLTYFV